MYIKLSMRAVKILRLVSCNICKVNKNISEVFDNISGGVYCVFVENVF
jgi:hypothetical protein